MFLNMNSFPLSLNVVTGVRCADKQGGWSSQKFYLWDRSQITSAILFHKIDTPPRPIPSKMLVALYSFVLDFF